MCNHLNEISKTVLVIQPKLSLEIKTIISFNIPKFDILNKIILCFQLSLELFGSFKQNPYEVWSVDSKLS